MLVLDIINTIKECFNHFFIFFIADPTMSEGTVVREPGNKSLPEPVVMTLLRCFSAVNDDVFSA